ncbi:MAG: 50S ribosomal protein L15, partial [Ignavibacteriales bacterium]|nr:50S ribosomal protein L15 [Ignavibacteriales bacterium]
MAYLSNLRYADGSRKTRKRVGRGQGSGRGGHTATRGMNGQRSRSGAKRNKAWFEGGQMPLQRRVPKFGFTPPFRVEKQSVNLYRLQKAIDAGKLADGAVIDGVTLYKAGVLRKANQPFKILAQGELNAKVTVLDENASEAAQKKIEAAGGTIKPAEAESKEAKPKKAKDAKPAEPKAEKPA